MSKFEYLNFLVDYTVCDMLGKVVHTGSYRLSDEQERHVFLMRASRAMRDGFEVRQQRRVHANKSGIIRIPGAFHKRTLTEYFLWKEAVRIAQPVESTDQFEIVLSEEDIKKYPELAEYSDVTVEYEPFTHSPKFHYRKEQS